MFKLGKQYLEYFIRTCVISYKLGVMFFNTCLCISAVSFSYDPVIFREIYQNLLLLLFCLIKEMFSEAVPLRDVMTFTVMLSNKSLL